MRSGPLKITLAITTILIWSAFLYLDSQWNACLRQSVEQGSKTYGELYGPLSFFRPLSMYLALALSLLCAGLLIVGAKDKEAEHGS